MKKQILIIHGGDSFNSYNEYFNYLKNKEINFEKHLKGVRFWKENLQEKLGDKYEILLPKMPCYQNAKYAEWKIWFEKFFPFLKNDIILIGGSQGGIFLAKYLSENNFPRKIKAVFLLAAPFSAKNRKDVYYTLGDFELSKPLKKFEKQAEKIFLYYSQDDPIVPFSDLEKYAQALPSAKKVIFKNKGHFILPEFPEFVEKIKNL